MSNVVNRADSFFAQIFSQGPNILTQQNIHAKTTVVSQKGDMIGFSNNNNNIQENKKNNLYLNNFAYIKLITRFLSISIIHKKIFMAPMQVYQAN